MDLVGCPPPFWLLCFLFIIGLCNVLMNSKGQIPLTVITRCQTDVSPYLDFHFWQEVFVESPRGGEQLAHWCGPSHEQGDFLTYFFLLEDTKQLVTRSNVRPAKDLLFPNRNQQPTPWRYICPGYQTCAYLNTRLLQFTCCSTNLFP